MKLAQSVKLGAWFLIALNLIMAFGSIWVFMRMAPAIEIIIEQNERSLEACEEMLSILVLANQSAKDVTQLESRFLNALNRANNNITEKEEPTVIDAIRKNYREAFSVNFESQKKTVSAILQLAEINRNAMVVADRKARRLGNAGAWGIVFMASAVFMVGMLFIRGLRRSLVKPLEEIHSVIQAVKTGDNMRRCTGPDAPQDIRTIFGGFNDILDQNTSNALTNKK
jgi:nitrate/nitrite-specific signal transduction histidine kinase